MFTIQSNQIQFLREQIDILQQQNNDLQKMIFRKFGILVDDRKTQPAPVEHKPVGSRTLPWTQRRQELESKDRETYWRNKGGVVEPELKEDTHDAG